MRELVDVLSFIIISHVDNITFPLEIGLHDELLSV